MQTLEKTPKTRRVRVNIGDDKTKSKTRDESNEFQIASKNTQFQRECRKDSTMILRRFILLYIARACNVSGAPKSIDNGIRN